MKHRGQVTRVCGRYAISLVMLALLPFTATAQPREAVRAIAPPRRPLPPEAESANVTRFSFIVYGDTRGRRDGEALQYEHSLVVDSAIATIKRLEAAEVPVAFVLQTGDAVVNGRDAKQWNASFVGLINRLTTNGGVPYFLAPGNHDVTGAAALTDPSQRDGLGNYLSAVADLIPPDGAPRRLPAIAVFHHPPFSSGPHGGPKLEPPSAALRANYLPLFRAHGVAMTLSGHEHFFEHRVERWQDADGRRHRMDHVVTGGGGAPIYPYRGEPDLAEYLAAGAADRVTLEHLARPGVERGDNPYHYVVVDVEGGELRLEVIGVDWGRDYQPYRSRRANLRDER